MAPRRGSTNASRIALVNVDFRNDNCGTSCWPTRGRPAIWSLKRASGDSCGCGRQARAGRARRRRVGGGKKGGRR
eukprot:187647-Chlamydomonas_euryale.AAC.3